MGDVTITESGMRFGVFSSDDVFMIEKSEQYGNMQCDIKTVEFILQRDGQILFIEAKSSTPNPANMVESEEKREKFDEYITSIAQKFSDSVSVYMSMLMKRLPQKEVLRRNRQGPIPGRLVPD